MQSREIECSDVGDRYKSDFAILIHYSTAFIKYICVVELA